MNFINKKFIFCFTILINFQIFFGISKEILDLGEKKQKKAIIYYI